MWLKVFLDRTLAKVFVLVVTPVAAFGDGLSAQQDGRTIAQAGAVIARAPDPSAVTHNPSAIVRLEGLQIVAGLGAGFPRDDRTGDPGEDAAERDVGVSPSPAAYLTWRPGRQSRWAIGLGFDAPIRHRQNGPPNSLIFPTHSRFEATLTEVHPVAAFAVDNRWSVGFGVRRLSGRLREAYGTSLAIGRAAGGRGGTYVVVGERSATAKVAAWAPDASVSFRTAVWGLGAVFSAGADLLADADIQVTRSNGGPAQAATRVEASTSYLLHEGARGLGFDVAPELRVAGWMAPASGLRIELDVVRTFWAAADWYRPQEIGDCGAACRRNLPRAWRDTLSIRLAAEHDLTQRFQVAAGIAKEPSPLSLSLEPGALPGDAWVYAVGGSLNIRRLSFDLGYAIHSGSSPSRHVVAVSARARF